MATVAEDVLLLTHTRADSGVWSEPDSLSEVLAGGCLIAEGLLGGLLRLDDGRRFATGPVAIGAEADPLVGRAARHALTVVPSAGAEKNDQRWLAEVTLPLRAAAEVVQRLRSTGAVRSEERKRFARRAETVTVTDPMALAAIHDRMRSVMLDGVAPDPATSLLCLTHAVAGGNIDLSRAERKRWDRRFEALFTWGYWQGDEGTPTEPTLGVDDATRRMVGDFVVSLGSAYHSGMAEDIFLTLELLRRGFDALE